VWLTRGFRKRSTFVGGETVRKLVAVSLLAVALLLIQASAGHSAGPEFPKPPGFRGHPAFPSPPGFPSPPRSHGHFRGDGDFRGDGVIVVGPSIWWDPWWYYPPPYYAYAPPPVIVQEPPVYVEPPAPPQSYWYYCQSARAYYPTAPTCPEAWIKVPPRAQ